MHSTDRAQIAFGIFTVLVGVGIGYLMYTHPEGRNPEWPLGMAMLVPALFAVAGLHVIAAGMGRTGFAITMLRAVLLFLGVIIHWAAFFTKNFECVQTISFLGVPIARWYPSEEECRISLQVLIAVCDALILATVGLFLWHRKRALRREPGR